MLAVKDGVVPAADTLMMMGKYAGSTDPCENTLPSEGSW